MFRHFSDDLPVMDSSMQSVLHPFNVCLFLYHVTAHAWGHLAPSPDVVRALKKNSRRKKREAPAGNESVLSAAVGDDDASVLSAAAPKEGSERHRRHRTSSRQSSSRVSSADSRGLGEEGVAEASKPPATAEEKSRRRSRSAEIPPTTTKLVDSSREGSRRSSRERRHREEGEGGEKHRSSSKDGKERSSRTHRSSSKEHRSSSKDDTEKSREHRSSSKERSSGEHRRSSKDDKERSKEHRSSSKERSSGEHRSSSKDDKERSREHRSRSKDEKEKSSKEHRSSSKDGKEKSSRSSSKEHRSSSKERSSSGKEHKSSSGKDGSSKDKTTSSRRRSHSSDAALPKRTGGTLGGGLTTLRPAGLSSLGGLTSSRLHSNNTSFGSQAPPMPMPGRPPLSGRSTGGLQPPPPPPKVSKEKEKVRSRPSSTHGSHRSHSSSRRHRSERETTERTTSSKEKKRVPFSLFAPRSWRSWLAAKDGTAVALTLSTVLRALPGTLLHYACELQRQVAALTVLQRFNDYGEGYVGLVQPLLGSGDLEGSSLCTSVTLLSSFMVARSLHRMTANYLEDKYFLDSSVVSQLMRSRKSTRRLLGWTMRLVSHTVLDTVFLSVTTSLLSVALDCSLHPSTTGLGNRALRTMLPLRWSVGGTLRALSCGAAAVGTQYLLSPIVTSLVDRGLVTVFVSSEYFLLRRYRTFPPDSDEESEEDDEELANEPHTDMESVAGDEDAAKKAEREYRRQRRQKRKLREAKQKAREDALRAAIYRNILYRVIATLVADVLAAHPLRVLTEVFRGRAMLHLTGMPFYYDKVQPGTAITKDDVVAFFHFETEDDVPPVVEGMRSAVKSLAVESEAVVAALQNNKNGLALTPQNFVGDSREKMKIVAYTLLPLFNGVQYTALDCLLGFYLSVWTRLYK